MVFQQGKAVSGDAEFQVAFPLEIVIGQTPLSAQAGKSAAKERWKNTVGTHVRKKIAETADWTYLDDRR